MSVGTLTASPVTIASPRRVGIAGIVFLFLLGLVLLLLLIRLVFLGLLGNRIVGTAAAAGERQRDHQEQQKPYHGRAAIPSIVHANEASQRR